MMIFSRYLPFIGSLLLLISCSAEGFSREALVRPTSQQLKIRSSKHPSASSSTTALDQASLVYPGDLPVGDENDEAKPNVLQRIRQQLLPRGGAAVEKPAKEGSFLKRHPFSSAVCITTINAVLADLLTQLVFESNPWNPKRSLVFGAFGFLYQGMVQYAIVNLVWEKLFPGTSKRAVAAKICGMNLLSDPLFFMPTFYIFQEAMTTGNLGWATIKAALLAYKGNCLMDWRNSWMVWFPGHAVTYGVMPSHKRIPWMAFLSFFYMCVLSITRGAI